MSRKTVPVPVFVYMALLVYICISYSVLVLQEPYVDLFVQEDHIYETVGSLGFFITAVLFVIALRKSRIPENKQDNPPLKQLSYLVLAIIFVIGAGEEISWGQRIFGFETPESLKEFNVQDEVSLHNLTAFQGEDASLMKVERLFTIFAFTFTLLIPLVANFSRPAAHFLNRVMPVPHWSLGLLFLANFMVAKIAKMLLRESYQHSTISVTQAVQEVKESNYAVLFVLVAAYIAFILLKPRSANAKTAIPR
jgi:hypothetical protein